MAAAKPTSKVRSVGSAFTSVGEVVTCGDDDPWKHSATYCLNRACAIGKMWAAENRITTYYGINSRPTMTHAGVQSAHPGGAHFLFADGHGAFLLESSHQDTLVALTTRAEGDIVGTYH